MLAHFRRVWSYSLCVSWNLFQFFFRLTGSNTQSKMDFQYFIFSLLIYWTKIKLGWKWKVLFEVSWVSGSQNLECYFCGGLAEVIFSPFSFFPLLVSELSGFNVYCISWSNVLQEGQRCPLQTWSVASSPLGTTVPWESCLKRWLVVKIARTGEGWHTQRCQKSQQGLWNRREHLQESHFSVQEPARYTFSRKIPLQWTIFFGLLVLFRQCRHFTQEKTNLENWAGWTTFMLS